MPSTTEFAVMETYVQVVKPLVTITEAIGAQKWVTISTVCPLLHKLLTITLIEKLYPCLGKANVNSQLPHVLECLGAVTKACHPTQ